jgi:hypothetical protein
MAHAQWKETAWVRTVLERLACHPDVKGISPGTLGDIHGDLNLHNVLCQLDPTADRPVILIDPRGVPRLDGFEISQCEPGDYPYDISKLTFSLSGFSEMRKGFYDFLCNGDTFELHLREHPGTDTLRESDRQRFEALASSDKLTEWIDAVEPSGLRSLELRVLIGEVAHYVADSACALGRNKTEEVLPLFVMGLLKLNEFLERIEGKEMPMEQQVKTRNSKERLESTNYRAATIQSAILGSTKASCPWDVLGLLVKSESSHTAYQLCSELIGDCLPEGMEVHLSTHPVAHVKLPCVLIQPWGFGDRPVQCPLAYGGQDRFSGTPVCLRVLSTS